jgi:hypothetical protein
MWSMWPAPTIVPFAVAAKPRTPPLEAWFASQKRISVFPFVPKA